MLGGSNVFTFDNTTNVVTISNTLQVSNNNGNITVGYNTGANTRLQMYAGESVGNITTGNTTLQNNVAVVLYNADSSGSASKNRNVYATSAGGNVDSPTQLNTGALVHEDTYMGYNSNNYVTAGTFRTTLGTANAKWRTSVANITPGVMTWTIGATNPNANVESLQAATHTAAFGSSGQYTLTFNEATSTTPGISVTTYNPTASIGTTLFMSRARGDTTTPAAVQAGDRNMSILASPYNGSNSRAGSQILSTVRSDAVIAAGNTVASDLSFLTIGNIYLGTQYANFLQSNSNVIIGISDGNTGNLTANVYYGNKAFLSNLTVANTANVVFYNSTTGELSQSPYTTLQGIQGIQGVTGNQGLQGLTGLQGLQGPTNLQGIQGLQGPAGSGSTPGSNTQVVYNDNGTLAGSSAFTFNNTSNTLTITNTSSNSVTATKFTEGVYNFGNATGTLTVDVNNGDIQRMTLTGNITLNSISNVANGSSMTLVMAQDATGNRLLSSTFKFAGNLRTLSTAANAIDVICVFYDGTNYLASLTKGYQ